MREGARIETDHGVALRGSHEAVTESVALAHLFAAAEEEQYDLHRRAAARAARIADAVEFARSQPDIYALVGDPDPVETAERCAIVELALRLCLSEAAVRAAASAAASRRQLPLLWARARDGFASLAQIEAAAAHLPRFDAWDALEADRVSALAHFDRSLAELAPSASPASFRARAALLARRLAPQPESQRHARVLADRRIVVTPADDGMSYLTAYLATQDALAITRRLTSTAKHLQKTDRDGRTRDQVRADLFVSWLRGVGTPSAVQTKVFVRVPLDRLAPAAQKTVRRGIAPRAGVDLSREPQLIGEGHLDDDTALRLLLEAGAFTRVITDPVTGVLLDMDRRVRTVTRAQREWLILTHGTCTRDGCRRPAADAEIDHWREFHGPERGPTDLENLHPFCAPDHGRKGRTKLRYRLRRDGTVQVVSPTGYSSRSEPLLRMPPERPPRPTLDRLLADRDMPDEPPF